MTELLSEVWQPCAIVERSVGETRVDLPLVHEGCAASIEVVRDPYGTGSRSHMDFAFLLGVGYDEPAVQFEFSESHEAWGWTMTELGVEDGILVAVATLGSSVLWADLTSGSARLAHQFTRESLPHDFKYVQLYTYGRSLLIITESDLVQLDLQQGTVVSDIHLGAAYMWRAVKADAATILFESRQTGEAREFGLAQLG